LHLDDLDPTLKQNRAESKHSANSVCNFPASSAVANLVPEDPDLFFAEDALSFVFIRWARHANGRTRVEPSLIDGDVEHLADE